MKREELIQLTVQVVEAYEAELVALGPMMKKKVREDLVAGFRDGVRSGANAVLKALDVKVEEP